MPDQIDWPTVPPGYVPIQVGAVRMVDAEADADARVRNVRTWESTVYVGGVAVLTERFLAHVTTPDAVAQREAVERASAAFGAALAEVFAKARHG